MPFLISMDRLSAARPAERSCRRSRMAREGRREWSGGVGAAHPSVPGHHGSEGRIADMARGVKPPRAAEAAASSIIRHDGSGGGVRGGGKLTAQRAEVGLSDVIGGHGQRNTSAFDNGDSVPVYVITRCPALLFTVQMLSPPTFGFVTQDTSPLMWSR